jgi:FxsC-like protein
MSYYIFFSYSRVHSQEAYLGEFLKDLSTEITQRVGTSKDIEIYFFDQEDIELGRDWKAALVKALQTSKVMVPIYSPPYFDSEYCGKEWQFFQMRREEYVKKKLGPELPPVIKPVIWLPPVPDDLGAAISAAQYTSGNKNDIFNKKGLRHVLKKKEEFKSVYTDYVEKLAQEIVDAAKTYKLPPLDVIPTLGEVKPPPPFPCRAIAAAEGIVQTSNVELPRHVRFVFIAADPNEFGNLRSQAAYVEKGGREWKPYYPNPENDIFPLVQHIVSGNELRFSSDELPFGPNLMQQVEEAREEGKIVILLVDGWTVNWNEGAQRILREFDKRNFINCSVLVPWNEKDVDTISLRDNIEATLKRTFFFSRLKAPIYYRDSIKNKEELQATLQDIITRIKATIRDFSDLKRPVPLGSAKPIVSGPGAATPLPTAVPPPPQTGSANP